jgi:hypothetical protein
VNTTIGAGTGSVTTTTTTTTVSHMILVPTGHRRPGVLDRLAMRVGLALILWGQRDTRRRSAEEVLLLRAAALEAERRREQLRSRLPNIL